MNKETFINNLKVREINVSDEQYDALISLMNSTLETNEKFNLTAIKDKDTFLEKMIYDSALAIEDIDLTNKKVIDVGTGAGYPGMVLRILVKDMDITLLDSTKKKIDYLNEYASSQGLKINGVSARAEDFANKNRETYDYAFARAVAPLNILLELIVPMLKVGGTFVALKGQGFEEELNASKKALEKLNCHLVKIVEDTLPECNEKRYMIHIQKDKVTNKKYPRQYNEIKKLPL